MTKALYAIVITTLLAGCATIFPPSDEARQNLARADTNTLIIALKLFRLDYSRFPTESEGIGALLHNPGVESWKGPYLQEEPIDPWGNPYSYTVTDDGFDITSAGPDGQFTTEDDVKNGWHRTSH